MLRGLRDQLRKYGVDVRRYEPDRDRGTQPAALEHLASLGVAPRTVFDVGAADGTVPLYEAWPDAHHVLIEPIAEFRPRLDELATELGSAEVVIAAAGPVEGEVELNVHPDLVGSSVMREHEDSDVNGIPRRVPQVQLDAFSRCEAPYVIKVDAQGYELSVLDGAERLLKDTEAVLLEVSLFQFFEGGPQLADVVAYMGERDFVTYDVLDSRYRPLDGALAQIDMVFVPAGSHLRRQHVYATRDQRADLNERLRPSLTSAESG